MTAQAADATDHTLNSVEWNACNVGIIRRHFNALWGRREERGVQVNNDCESHETTDASTSRSPVKLPCCYSSHYIFQQHPVQNLVALEHRGGGGAGRTKNNTISTALFLISMNANKHLCTSSSSDVKTDSALCKQICSFKKKVQMKALGDAACQSKKLCATVRNLESGQSGRIAFI